MPATPRSPRSDTVDAQLGVAETLCEQRGRRPHPSAARCWNRCCAHGRSLKAYELLDAMRAVHPGAAPPTVYRALDFLMEEGLIHRLDAVNAWSACHDAGGAPHDLLVVCTGCGAVAEVSDPAMSRQLAERVAQTGYALATHETEIRALCPQCQQEAARGRRPDTITTIMNAVLPDGSHTVRLTPGRRKSRARSSPGGASRP